MEKVIDQTSYLSGKRRGGILKEEVWFRDGSVAKYSLAYINPALCGVDNGRILGYDNNHGHHHRHFMGVAEPVDFTTYADLLRLFQREVEALWREHESRD
ncbi:MAG: toxin-antitoxin system TumE family protein [Acidobacteriaceae bacterium]